MGTPALTSPTMSPGKSTSRPISSPSRLSTYDDVPWLADAEAHGAVLALDETTDALVVDIAKGDDAVRHLIDDAVPMFEFAVRTTINRFDLDTAEGRVAALQRCVPLVAHIKREELRDEYARRLAGWVSWDDIAMVVREFAEGARRAREAGLADSEIEAPFVSGASAYTHTTTFAWPVSIAWAAYCSIDP